jgi:hypothetical protein
MSNDLQNHVKSIVQTIENGLDSIEREDEGQFPMDGLEYLSDALDIEYIVNGNRDVLGARILVCFGGPNIWINTRTKQVEGYWWSDKCVMSYDKDEIGLDDAIETLWSC